VTSIAGLVRKARAGRMSEQAVGLFWWLGTCSLALILLIINATVANTAFDVPVLVAFVAGSAQGAALPLVLVRPVYATALQFGGVALYAFVIPVGESSTWPLTPTGLVTLIAYIGICTVRAGWKTAVATWWASALLLILLVLVDPRGRGVDGAQPALILYPSISAGALLTGLGVRYGATIRRQLAEARRDVAVEQSQRAVAEERTRIARELHDVVAHNMSVIHMQATSAAYRIKDLDPESRAEFARIAAGARSTMREMRQLLAVLRDERTDPQLAPVPNLNRLDELAEGARQAGVPVSVRMADDLLVPETIGAAGYRIVQESLSNVIRHAPGARTSVALDLENGDLAILVVNEPAGLPAVPLDEPGRAGHGLDGMRERVRLLGGSLVTGPVADGGYRVAARLPIGGAR
jgi:signal transduction histidine kinase